MEPIREGASGAAVEDIQERLTSLGYKIDEHELGEKSFGPTTANAVGRFRMDQDIPLGTEVDSATWSALVDAGYKMGDRTLYLRLPNLHGNDVLELQKCLNILGFSCGKPDGCYGVYTEAAVKEFQESQGMLADGMAFPDTFDAIERLHHVWAGKPADGPHPMGGMGFARAAGVLEHTQISLTAEDPISRNVAGRIWNLATATTDKSGLGIVESVDASRPDDDVVIVLGTTDLPEGSKLANLSTEEIESLPLRLRTTVESAHANGVRPPVVRLELPHGLAYDGTFTTSDAQTFAVMLLDAICSAFNL
ncbi:MAG: peptidoglycan-binding protein [Coriobacteriaceae bacterium]|nr:MAG: peptidoglycan-binding protein [Coriobacteriaceae bacterium]